MVTWAVVGVLVVLGGAFAVAIYNRLVRAKNLVEEAWSGMDVQMKRRTDLIPNLVETVKGYMQHERGVLEQVTTLRAKSLGATTVEERAAAEGAMSRALGNLFAVAENYPDLKANQNFLELQKSAERHRGADPIGPPLLQRHGQRLEHPHRKFPQ